MFSHNLRTPVMFMLLVLGLPLSHAAASSVKEEPPFDRVLVACNNRDPGITREIAAYCHKPGLLDYAHMNLGRSVVSIDRLPLQSLDVWSRYKLIKGQEIQHVQDDATKYKFPNNYFDLLFIELPPCYEIVESTLAQRSKEYRDAPFTQHTGTMLRMLKNLSPALKPGGLLQIEHLPYAESLECKLNPFLIMENEGGVLVVDALRKQDPFTYYHLDESSLYVLYFALKATGEDKKITPEAKEDLARTLLNRQEMQKFITIVNRTRVLDKFASINKLTENQVRNFKAALKYDTDILCQLPEAIKIRARHENVFPEVIARIVAMEILNNKYNQADTYFNCLAYYCHMLHLRENIALLNNVLAPLGYENASVTIRKKSHNGRPYAWWIEAKKRA